MQIPSSGGSVLSANQHGENGEWNLSAERYRSNGTSQTAFDMAELGDATIFTIESGGTPKSTEEAYWNGGIHWATLVDLPQGDFISQITKTERTITEAGLANSSAKILPVGTVVVSSRATIGRVGIARIPLATNQGFKNIVIKDAKRGLPEFVAYMMKHLAPDMEAMATGGTFKEISKSTVATLKIPLPPLDVQKEIVAEIEGYQKIIDGARQVVESYQPRISIRPEWPMVELSELIKLSSGQFLSGAMKNEGPYPVYGGNGINGYHSEYFLESPTIVIGRVGAYCGAVHVTQPKSWVTDNGLYVKEFVKDSDLPFLALSLTHLNLNQYAKVGGQPSISQAIVLERKIPFPDLDTQRTIVGQIETEQRLVNANKELIRLFEDKIKATINRVWGEAE